MTVMKMKTKIGRLLLMTEKVFLGFRGFFVVGEVRNT